MSDSVNQFAFENRFGRACHENIAAGLPSELDAQLGSLCRAGDEAGVPTPVLDLTHSLLVPREAAARGRS